jgi:ubiquinone/menaquinone biosynthesis C-methylase UbiE
VSSSSRYLLGDSRGEIRHLVAQAEVYAEEAEQLLDMIRLEPGRAAIDVGCGVLGVLHLLAERVGPNGHVVGLDRQARIIAEGRKLAEQSGLAVEFVEADATATELPAASFDLVHARTLLLNVDNPEQVVAEMVRLVRPDGVVALQEPDSGAWTCDPPHPAFDLLKSAVVEAYRCTGKDFDVGRRIARLLREAGAVDVRVRATARATQAGEYYQTFVLTLANLVREVITASCGLTDDQLDAYAADLRDHLEAPGTITCQPVIWQAWGRVAA